MRKISRSAIAVSSLLICQPALAETLQPTEIATSNTDNKHTQKTKINKIVVVSNAIFDESDPDAFFIHRWANYLHINTRESAILNKLSFNDNDQVSQKDLDEAQRILRYEPYIRDAKINFATKDPAADIDEEGETVLVETWDNWSLLPTFSAGRSGGESKFSFGIKEDNLLGYGIRTRLKYKSSADRTGYQLAFQAPMDNWVKHSTLSANFYDNSDGQATQLDFTKPFYTLDSVDMYSGRYVDDLRVDTLRQNGNDINEFQHQINYANAQYGWRLNREGDWRSRIIVGVTQDEHTFDNIELYPDSVLPQDRDYLYPWAAYQYIQDDFKVLNNVHLINYNEDFNLGWQHYVKLGIETQDLNDSAPVGYHIDWRSSRGYQDEQQLILLAMNGEGVFATSQPDYFKVNAIAEYFYQITPKWTAYSKVSLSTSQNNYLDKTFALGDNTGVRGYPNDYQHGDNQWLVTAEIRNYPNINLYQLAELGWAVFTDYGQASGGPDANNEESAPIGSVGIGARIYSSRSSYGNVAHIDFSVPFTTGEEVNSWEWRFQVKRHF
ncbi:hypothetical protein BEL05_20500 [Shewanella colwelliana]|uniref:Haemolysin activator HlyB C-terminal domain-containing protein n=1 Tax=Shewanella colwelliana TaxID=23 RepID=A0A1E5IU17_SHECO|nr:hypothetical protein [Shewanella colwelliana]OEG74059.1 hypothetical protein BEL05_20500 [Shewanella colwelliana]